jgi:hypothetical protein
LLTKYAVLLAKIVDGPQVTLVHPARQGNQQESKGVQELCHRIVPFSDGMHADLAQIQADRILGPYAIAYLSFVGGRNG